MKRIVPTLLALAAIGRIAVAQTPANDVWTVGAIPDAPNPIGRCGGMTGVNNGNDLYVLAGGRTQIFLRYSILGHAWTLLDECPLVIGANGRRDASGTLALPTDVSLCHDGGDSIFAAIGTHRSVSGLAAFARYSISEDDWAEPGTIAMPNTGFQPPLGVGPLVSDALGTLIAVVRYPNGAPVDRAIHRYTVATNTWTFVSSVPGYPFPLDDLATAAYPGSGDAVYFLDGSTLLIYSLSTGGWNVAADGTPLEPRGIPTGNIDYNWPLACAPGGGHLVALRDEGPWVYSIEDNEWAPGPPLPAPIGDSNTDTVGDGVAIASPGGGAPLFALPGGGSPACWLYERPNLPPAAPTELAQFRLNGSTPIGTGSENGTVETGFVATARLADPDGEALRLEFRVLPVGTPFTGDVADRSSAQVASGTVAVVRYEDGLTPGQSYHWQARAVDARGLKSDWASFGTDPDDPDEADLKVLINRPPTASLANQRSGSDRAAIPVGGRILPESSIVLEAVLDDPDLNATSFEVEVVSCGSPYRGLPTAATPLLPQGARARVELRLSEGNFEWRYRAVDFFGTASNWERFGGNADASPDLTVLAAGSTNSSACSQSAVDGPPTRGIGPGLALALLLLGRRLRNR